MYRILFLGMTASYLRPESNHIDSEGIATSCAALTEPGSRAGLVGLRIRRSDGIGRTGASYGCLGRTHGSSHC